MTVFIGTGHWAGLLPSSEILRQLIVAYSSSFFISSLLLCIFSPVLPASLKQLSHCTPPPSTSMSCISSDPRTLSIIKQTRFFFGLDGGQITADSPCYHSILSWEGIDPGHILSRYIVLFQDSYPRSLHSWDFVLEIVVRFRNICFGFLSKLYNSSVDTHLACALHSSSLLWQVAQIVTPSCCLHRDPLPYWETKLVLLFARVVLFEHLAIFFIQSGQSWSLFLLPESSVEMQLLVVEHVFL